MKNTKIKKSKNIVDTNGQSGNVALHLKTDMKNIVLNVKKLKSLKYFLFNSLKYLFFFLSRMEI